MATDIATAKRRKIWCTLTSTAGARSRGLLRRRAPLRCPLRADRLPRRGRALRSAALARGRLRVSREGASRRRAMALALECAAHGARPLRRRLLRTLAPLREVTLRLLLRPRRRPLLRGQLHTGAPRLRQPDRNGLLRRSSAVFPFTHVLDLFAYEFASLRGRRLPLALVLARAT